jgi:TonB family protein
MRVNRFLNTHFTFEIAIIASVILHIVFIFIYLLQADDNAPKDKEEEARYVKVKIGRMHYESAKNAHKKPKAAQKVEKKAQKPVVKKAVVKRVKKAVVKKKPIVKAPKKSIARPIIKKPPMPAKKQQVVKQVTKKQKPKPAVVAQQGNSQKVERAHEAARGSVIGNKKKAEKMAIDDYRQTVTLWLQKHKVYPKAAENLGLGDTVDAKVKLRIARNGRLVRYWLLESAGNDIIDDAVIKMIENSNPFPPFPKGYPSGEVDDFEIEMEVRLKRSLAERYYNP